MIKFKNVTLKNFMSVGNVTQAVNLENIDLTLVLGHNIDLGGDGSKNGVGKSSLINAISYALYGSAVSSIKKDNLINNSNNKHMLVTIEFEVNGVKYRIERGRKPAILKFIVNSVRLQVEETDEGQGEARKTQAEIEKVLGINHTIFKHIVALNTYSEPFLSLRISDQRDIIEHLFGITTLSEKANILKDRIKDTKDNIKEEEYRIKGIENANEQIKKTIKTLKVKQNSWIKKNKKDIEEFKNQIKELESIDIDKELLLHKEKDEYKKTMSEKYELSKEIATKLADIKNEQKKLQKTLEDIEKVNNNTCYACGQPIIDEQHKKIMAEKTEVAEKYKKFIKEEEETVDKLQKELNKIEDIGPEPKTSYTSIEDAYKHKTLLSTLNTTLKKSISEENPFTNQIEELNEKGIQVIEFDIMNGLHKLKEHQEFLLKLLINKDSIVRKKVIEQNLQYLNARLGYYLDKLGLPHEVQFQSDLSVDITQLGRNLDFDNLSRGERNRLILALNFGFRDVHESMNTPIDFMSVDEMLDSGLDSSGIEASLGVLKSLQRDRGKNIFLISHREELMGRVNNILYVTKENGFTHFSREKEFDI